MSILINTTLFYPCPFVEVSGNQPGPTRTPTVSLEQHEALQREVTSLREAVHKLEQLATVLMNDIDEGAKERRSMQVEIDRIRKLALLPGNPTLWCHRWEAEGQEGRKMRLSTGRHYRTTSRLWPVLGTFKAAGRVSCWQCVLPWRHYGSTTMITIANDGNLIISTIFIAMMIIN